MRDLGILLVIAGVTILLVGILVLFAGRLPWLGHLPGDFTLRGKNWSFSFPIVTCMLISILLTICLNILARLLRR